MIYRLITSNTVDQRILERAESKRKLEKMVMHKGRFKGRERDEKSIAPEGRAGAARAAACMGARLGRLRWVGSLMIGYRADGTAARALARTGAS